jgi:large subunit ribosomal protein L18
MSKLSTREARLRRHRRVRGKVSGTAGRPRLAVFRSNRGVFAQLVDDEAGRTLAAASWLDVRSFKGTKTDQATEVGKALAAAARDAGITSCVFDRGGYLYHGRVKALAEGAREGGLEF